MLTNAAAVGGNPFQQVQQSPPLPIVDVGHPAPRAAYAELMIRKGRPWRTLFFFFPSFFVSFPFFSYFISVWRALTNEPGCACAHDDEGEPAGESGGVYSAEQCALCTAAGACGFSSSSSFCCFPKLNTIFGFALSLSHEGASAAVWGARNLRTDGGECTDSGDRVRDDRSNPGGARSDCLLCASELVRVVCDFPPSGSFCTAASAAPVRRTSCRCGCCRDARLCRWLLCTRCCAI